MMSTTRNVPSLFQALFTGFLFTLIPFSTTFAEDKGNDVIAEVNGKKITAHDLNTYALVKRSTESDKQFSPAKLLDEMINKELIKQEAIKQGMDKNQNYISAMEIQSTNLLVNAMVAEQLKDVKFTDDALKEEYDRQVEGTNLKEFKARHIVVESEDTAKSIIKDLKSGADFSQLAKTKSTGPSGPNGGDLGWFKATSMVPEFAAAIKSMQKGQTSATPVKTQFGWHVILLEDERKIEPPTFEKSKERLKSILANKNLQAYIGELRKKAKVSIKGQAAGN